MKRLYSVATTAAALTLIGGGTGYAAKAHHATPAKGKTVTTRDGLKYQDITVGKGASAKPGQSVTVDYVGTLTSGKKFDASRDHPGGTFSFVIGQGQVIKGWDEGVLSMKVGGERRLTVPPSLGYGAAGAGGVIPPNATLIFDIKLLGVQ